MPKDKGVFEFNRLYDVNLELALNSVIYGQEMIKLGCCGKPHVRKFFIDKDLTNELRWITPAKYREASKISVHSILGISFGFQTSLFRKHMANLAGKEELAMSIIYTGRRGAKKDLNVVFMDPEQMRRFVTGLQYIVLKESCQLVLSRKYRNEESAE
ncbi:MAG: hypothetical protein P4M11_12875 [Candidatus Pacebacteria bacterium]|nr:hypothetical protein [Candidatus Paceibacterota bacterium]